MMIRHIFTIGLLSAVGLTAIAADNVDTKYEFASNSLLASGKWVRVEVPETGIYEITYNELKEMGFSNPESVGVYGRGGTSLDHNFLTSGGNKQFFDNPQQVPVLFSNGKLIFYANGTEKIKAEYNGDYGNVKFTRESRNIYSDKTYYYLSDTAAPLLIETSNDIDKNNSDERALGFAYYYYEKDLWQGNSNTGQTFYGDKITTSQPRSYSFTVPYVGTGNVFVTAQLAMGKATGNVYVDFNGTTKNEQIILITGAMKSVAFNGGALSTEGLGNGYGKGTITFSQNANFSGSLNAVDWWIAGYPVNINLIASDKTLSQQYVSLTPTSKNYWKIKVPSKACVWNIANRNYPVALENDNGMAYGVAYSAPSELVVFNPISPMKKVAGWQELTGQNLHALQQEGIELLIFSTTDMKPYADRIAAAHEKYDGIKVAVVTPDQIYTEFSYGITDPVAYRAMAKMLFHNKEIPLKNVLFLGNMSSDLRNIRNTKNTAEALIAYQETSTDPSNSPLSCVMDYFGIMTDNSNRFSTLNQAPISLGVGVLPVIVAEEGSNVASKIEEYLAKQDFSNILNETWLMSCNGDSYTHDIQSVNYSNMMQNILDKELSSKFSHSQIRFDGLNTDVRRQQYHNTFDRGKLYGVYFGHGIEYSLGATISIEDELDLQNNELGFWFIAACDLCSPDMGRQGIGDSGVTKTKKGFIGTIAGTRSVMSNDNYALAESFYRNLYYDAAGKTRTSNPTVGEAYAIAKNQQISKSSLAFLLIGDPAIKLPLPLGKVKMEIDGDDAHPGNVVTVTGSVLDANSNELPSYKGYVTVKLMEPAMRQELPISKNNGEPYASYITDLRLATVNAKVENGKFTVKLPIPAKASQYMTTEGNISQLPIMAATYDPTTKLGCSGIANVTMAHYEAKPSPSAERDTKAPKVTLAYDQYLKSLQVEAIDDIALIPGIGAGKSLTLTIGDRSLTSGSELSEGVASTSYSNSVSIAGLKPGTYTAKATARDLAGNVSDPVTLTFTVSEAAALTLVPSSDFAIDEMQFSINGQLDGETCTLVIADSEGNIVVSEDGVSGEVTCDLSELPAGIYRAAVRHNSAKGALLSSNWVNFTVID